MKKNKILNINIENRLYKMLEIMSEDMDISITNDKND